MTEAKLTVNVTKLSPEAHIPTQGSPHAAGWDLRALEKTVIHKGKSSKKLIEITILQNIHKIESFCHLII